MKELKTYDVDQLSKFTGISKHSIRVHIIKENIENFSFKEKRKSGRYKNVWTREQAIKIKEISQEFERGSVVLEKRKTLNVRKQATFLESTRCSDIFKHFLSSNRNVSHGR